MQCIDRNKVVCFGAVAPMLCFVSSLPSLTMQLSTNDLIVDDAVLILQGRSRGAKRRICFVRSEEETGEVFGGSSLLLWLSVSIA